MVIKVAPHHHEYNELIKEATKRRDENASATDNLPVDSPGYMHSHIESGIFPFSFLDFPSIFSHLANLGMMSNHDANRSVDLLKHKKESHTFDQVFDKYKIERSENIIPTTLAAVQRSFFLLKSFLEKKLKCEPKLSDINKDVAREFILYMMDENNNNLALTTRKKIIAEVSGVINWSYHRNLIEDNPFGGLSNTIKGSRKGSISSISYKAWDDESVYKALCNLKTNAQLRMFVMLLHMPFRIEELANVLTDDVFLDDDNKNYIRINNGKSSAAVRNIPIHPSVIELVRIMMENTDDGYLISGLKRTGHDGRRGKLISNDLGKSYRVDCGITDKAINSHSLRHTFITKAVNANFQYELVGMLAGHTPKKEKLTLSIYTESINHKTALDIIIAGGSFREDHVTEKVNEVINNLISSLLETGVSDALA
ncbi:MAG: site-specific integrase [Candidatus Thiodiazotropha endolucinida]